MPKAGTPKKTPRTPTKSPRKKPSKPAPAPVDESTWRPSQVSASSTITKTAAMSLYRLKEADLAALPAQQTATMVTMAGRKEVRPMYLYKERDVERQAWRKHTCPEGFEAYLNTLRGRFEVKPTNRGKPFPAPSAYTSASVSIRTLPPAPALRDPDDAWVVTPGLHALRPRFPRWLWRACNARLDRVGDHEYNFGPRGVSHAQREAAMRAALATLAARYPPRAEEPLAPSPAADKLRQVLERAPKDPKDEGMDEWEDGFSGETDYFWGDGYLGELFQALIDVIEAHGIEGWEKARWEVYDKYASCFRGVSYDEREDTWYDHAFAWLCGWLEHRPSCLSTRRCEYSEVGRRYNDMLPRLSIGKNVL
ncbi:hypothetical protein PsYK624_111020 [Phanerochaete sordida]|uniref:Uncharacterized protein n=1 Tax=Phanerochaete sordida TaxID=48140 RepID=A0A9P3GHA5_9APHY|nr:hypothetical protein PsYK624_111020 [Phanerochaete sordida]